MRKGGKATFKEFCRDVNIAFASHFSWVPAQVDDLMLDDFWGFLEWMEKSSKPKGDPIEKMLKTKQSRRR